jgi:hypothetical protein
MLKIALVIAVYPICHPGIEISGRERQLFEQSLAHPRSRLRKASFTSMLTLPRGANTVDHLKNLDQDFCWQL